MATFAELLADVYTLTNRPDLVDETKLAVKQATLKAHHTDFYPKDLYEVGVSFASAAYLQSLEYRTLIPRYRALKFLRKSDVTGTPGTILTVLTPEQILDSYSQQKVDICYLAGTQIEIKSSTELQYMLLGCYMHPDITELGFSSWIALDHPYAIVYEAASTLFKMIGYDEQAAMMKQNVLEQFTVLRMELSAVGY